MDRINGADTIDIGGGRRGFRDENLITGASGTEVTALFLNMTQEEILKVITEAGLAPSEGDWTQLWQALQILGLAPDRGRRWLAVNSMTLSSAPGAPAVGDAYVVPLGATGIWAGNVGKIAVWFGSGWTYLTPTDGHGVSLPDGRIYERIAGTYIEKLALDAQSGKWLYAVAAGSANALSINLTPAPLAYVEGLAVNVLIANSNTGSGTLKVGNLSAVDIVQDDGVPLGGGELVAGQIASFIYRSGVFQLRGLSSLNRHPINNALWGVRGTYSFQVPTNVSNVWVRVWGAGGGGGGAGGGSAGGGGGAGGYIEGWLKVTPGETIPIVIGKGGDAGFPGGNGQSGGASSFGPYLTAYGGVGGNGTSSGATDGGVGGTALGNGQKSFEGGTGQRSYVFNGTLIGGVGGASYGVSPAHFVASDGFNIAGRPGVEPGGGGGGGIGGGIGGIGRDGTIQVIWG